MDITLGIEIIKYFLTVAAGIVLGNAAVFLFNKMPAEWFVDYGKEPSPELRDPYVQRIKSYPWKYTLSMLFVAVGLYLVREDWMYAVSTLVSLWLLTEMAAADLKYRVVPDQLIVLLAVSAIGTIHFHDGWRDMLLGAVTGFGVMFITAFLGKLMYRRETIGGGDIKLFAALGLVTGFYGILAVFVITTLISAGHLVYLLITKKVNRKDTVPMVPYIAVAAGIYMVFIHTKLDQLIITL